jgi:hypothetical protein
VDSESLLKRAVSAKLESAASAARVRERIRDGAQDESHYVAQVRKTPCWPRRWAKLSLL